MASTCYRDYMGGRRADGGLTRVDVYMEAYNAWCWRSSLSAAVVARHGRRGNRRIVEYGGLLFYIMSGGWQGMWERPMKAAAPASAEINIVDVTGISLQKCRHRREILADAREICRRTIIRACRAYNCWRRLSGIGSSKPLACGADIIWRFIALLHRTSTLRLYLGGVHDRCAFLLCAKATSKRAPAKC